MNTFDPILQEGIAVAILVAIGLFIWRKGWPFLTRTLERAQSENIRLINEFLLALERRDKSFEQVVRELDRIVRTNGLEIKPLGKRRKGD